MFIYCVPATVQEIGFLRLGQDLVVYWDGGSGLGLDIL